MSGFGRDGSLLTMANIIEMTDRNPVEVIEIVGEVIDDPAKDIPAFVRTSADVSHVQELMAYYGNWYATLVNFWAKVRAKAGKDHNRIAVRDGLEKQISACNKKYEAASRALTAFQEMNQGQHTRLL